MPLGCMWDLGYPIESASELLDGTLKLRHCTILFTMRLTPWSLPGVGNGSGKSQSVTPGHLLDEGGKMRVKGSGKPGIHVQLHLLVSFRIRRIQRRGDGKDCAHLPPMRRG